VFKRFFLMMSGKDDSMDTTDAVPVGMTYGLFAYRLTDGTFVLRDSDGNVKGGPYGSLEEVMKAGMDLFEERKPYEDF